MSPELAKIGGVKIKSRIGTRGRVHLVPYKLSLCIGDGTKWKEANPSLEKGTSTKFDWVTEDEPRYKN